MSAPEENSEFCFLESLNVSRDEVEGNIESRGKTKLTISRGSRYRGAGKNFFWDHFGWELCNRAYYNAIRKLRLTLTLTLTPTLTA